MRLAVRHPSDRPPRAIWSDLADARRWDRVLRYPGGKAIRRVKVVDGTSPAVGRAVQVLFEDLTWTRHRLLAWQPEKRLESVVEAEGSGDDEGQAPALPWSERLILIPQGYGSEVEWSVKFHPLGIGRLVAPLSVPKEAWKDALELRVRATA